MAAPVTIVDAGGLPVTNTESLLAGTPMTPVDAGGIAVTLVESGGYPVALINSDGTLWSSFDLDDFMAAQSDGFWYDFLQTDGRLMQEATGPTPADAADEVIGLALEGRLWAGASYAALVAAQTELAVGTWTQVVGTGTIVGSGTTVTFTNAANNDRATPPAAAVVGKWYRVAVTVSGITEGAVRVSDGGSPVFATISTNTSQTIVYRAASTDLRLIAVNETSASVAISIKEIPGQHSTQATTAAKPKWQTAGTKFDGSDDNLLSAYLAQNGANFIVARVTVPATLAATQVIAGASGSSANRTFLAINTSGQLCAGVGSESTTTILGSTDLRGTEAVVGLAYDGSVVKLFAGTAEEYSAAQASTPTTSIPYRLGSLNNNGTAGSFFAGNIADLLVGREMLDLATFKNMRTALLAA